MKNRLFIFLIVVIASLPLRAQMTGMCGENLTWSLTGDVLTITGSGDMDNSDYSTRLFPDEIAQAVVTVILSDSVTSIGDFAFRSCPNLQSVRISDSVTKIGKGAFLGCQQLASIRIPRNVNYIGGWAFYRCSGLASIVVASDNPTYDSRNGCKAIIHTATNELIAGCKSTVIPNNVTSIGEGAFYGCSGLKSVTIPVSVTRIGLGAFCECTSLAFITIPNSVTHIGKGAFYGCTRLSSVTIPSRMKVVEEKAFGGCTNLTSATIASNATDVHSKAFADNVRITRLNLNVDVQPTDNASAHEIRPSTIAEGLASLVVVPGSLQFTEASGNQAIDAYEKCSLTFRVKNEGKGPARNCTLKVTATGATNGITIEKTRLPILNPGATQDLTVSITSSRETADGELKLIVQVDEPNGFGTDPMELTIQTFAFRAPQLQIVDYAVTGQEGGRLYKKVPFSLQLMLQNTKYGKADDVQIDLVLPENVIVIAGDKHRSFDKIDGGEAKSIDYELIVNNNYSSTSIPVKVNIKEKFGIYSENKTITLQLNQLLSTTKLNIEAVEQTQRGTIERASIGSDVDKNIPQNPSTNAKTFVLIIANEVYQEVAPVPFALHDGEVFKQYCEQTLGIVPNHIRMYDNATLNNMRTGIRWITDALAVNAEASAIIYYTGHGIPDEGSKSAYLLPVDGTGQDVETAYSVKALYETLGSTDKPVTVFLDACFSGAQRDGTMIAQAKGVALATRSSAPQGKTVVFSAATGSETAGFYKKQGHGMFTYWLLKALQESAGDINYEQLSQSIYTNVRITSFDENNGKTQTPTVMNGDDAYDWERWKLK